MKVTKKIETVVEQEYVISASFDSDGDVVIDIHVDGKRKVHDLVMTSKLPEEVGQALIDSINGHSSIPVSSAAIEKAEGYNCPIIVVSSVQKGSGGKCTISGIVYNDPDGQVKDGQFRTITARLWSNNRLSDLKDELVRFNRNYEGSRKFSTNREYFCVIPDGVEI